MNNAKIEFKPFPRLLKQKYAEAAADIVNVIDSVSTHDKPGIRTINDNQFGLICQRIAKTISEIQSWQDSPPVRTHSIKLMESYCDAVLNGEKTFEIRFNDRAYQKGDYIKFLPMADVDGNKVACIHPVSEKKYIITYVLPYEKLRDGYVALGIKEVEE